MKVISPRSSESKFPLLIIDRKIKFGFFLQISHPFGLYIRIPCVMARWGSA